MKPEALSIVRAIKAIPLETIPKWQVLEAINEALAAPAATTTTEAPKLTPFDAVARAMSMASLLAGAVARDQVDAVNTYSAQLRAHLVRYIYPGTAAIADPAPVAPEHLPTAEHIRALAQEALEQVMEQAQVFASAWSLVGGRFDTGNAMEDAEEAKAELRTLVRSLADLAAETVRPAAAPQAEPAPSEPAHELPEERRQLQHLLDDIVEEAEQDGATYYRIRDGKDILFSNMVGACARLLAKPEAAAHAAEADPPPEREPFTADVECITDESGTGYSVAVRGPGIRNPLYSDVWLKKERQAAMLAKWLNDDVLPIMAGIGTKGGDNP